MIESIRWATDYLKGEATKLDQESRHQLNTSGLVGDSPLNVIHSKLSTLKSSVLQSTASCVKGLPHLSSQGQIMTTTDALIQKMNVKSPQKFISNSYYPINPKTAPKNQVVSQSQTITPYHQTQQYQSPSQAKNTPSSDSYLQMSSSMNKTGISTTNTAITSTPGNGKNSSIRKAVPLHPIPTTNGESEKNLGLSFGSFGTVASDRKFMTTEKIRGGYDRSSEDTIRKTIKNGAIDEQRATIGARKTPSSINNLEGFKIEISEKHLPLQDQLRQQQEQQDLDSEKRGFIERRVIDIDYNWDPNFPRYTKMGDSISTTDKTSSQGGGSKMMQREKMEFKNLFLMTDLRTPIVLNNISHLSSPSWMIKQGQSAKLTVINQDQQIFLANIHPQDQDKLQVDGSIDQQTSNQFDYIVEVDPERYLAYSLQDQSLYLINSVQAAVIKIADLQIENLDELIYAINYKDNQLILAVKPNKIQSFDLDSLTESNYISSTLPEECGEIVEISTASERYARCYLLTSQGDFVRFDRNGKFGHIFFEKRLNESFYGFTLNEKEDIVSILGSQQDSKGFYTTKIYLFHISVVIDRIEMTLIESKVLQNYISGPEIEDRVILNNFLETENAMYLMCIRENSGVVHFYGITDKRILEFCNEGFLHDLRTDEVVPGTVMHAGQVAKGEYVVFDESSQSLVGMKMNFD